MAATIAATMAMINSKCLNPITGSSPKSNNPKLPPSKPTLSLFSIQNFPKGITSNVSTSTAGTAIAGAIFSSLANCDAALAASQIAEIAEGDNRGLALLLPLIPAIAWVLFNILQPALNQLNRMRSSKGVIIGLGLGLGASGMLFGLDASASEISVIADAAASDNRGQLLLIVVTPAIVWVLYNILQPALNQLNRMRSE
ncbi:Photosystem II core complex proteins psbY, chloroplastic [Glycine max]|nr:Photosystem II core complex proteins psbY, chloroplastic [Glycine max]